MRERARVFIESEWKRLSHLIDRVKVETTDHAIGEQALSEGAAPQ